jgi:hypothetical protein
MRNLLKNCRTTIMFLACCTITGCGTDKDKTDNKEQQQSRETRVAVFPDEVQLNLCGSAFWAVFSKICRQGKLMSSELCCNYVAHCTT